MGKQKMEKSSIILFPRDNCSLLWREIPFLPFLSLSSLCFVCTWKIPEGIHMWPGYGPLSPSLTSPPPSGTDLQQWSTQGKGPDLKKKKNLTSIYFEQVFFFFDRKIKSILDLHNRKYRDYKGLSLNKTGNSFS